MMTSFSNLCFPPPGLSAEAGVYSHPGSPAEHNARLLAHGVGVPDLLHHHAYQPRGEEQGELRRSWGRGRWGRREGGGEGVRRGEGGRGGEGVRRGEGGR